MPTARPTRPVCRALLLVALLLGALAACSDDGSSDGGPEGGGGGSGDGGGSGEGARPVGEGVVAAAATPFAAPEPAVAPVGPGTPVVGTCLLEGSFDTGSLRLGLGTTAPCTEPHAAQVIGVVGLPPDKVATYVDGGEPLTGGVLSSYGLAVAQVSTESRIACQATFDALSASALALDPELDGDRRVWALQDEVRIPTPDEWDGGARWAACLVEGAEDVPITGVPDVTTVRATDPMPVGLQVCGNVTGRRVPCDDDIVQVQAFLQVVIEVPDAAAEGGLATAEEKDRANDRCAEALASYAPDLAEDDAEVQVYASQVIEQEQTEPGKQQGVGQPLATCSVAPTAAKGLGLPSLVP